MIPVLIIILIFTFVVMRVIPGNPAIVLLGPHATAHEIEVLTKEFGFDQPILTQFFSWVTDLLKGDFGRSIYWNQPVLPFVISKLEPSFWLALVSITFISFMGITTGIISAVKKDTWIDQTVLGGALLGASLPSFWTGLVLMWFIGVNLRLLPESGFESIFHTGNLANLRYLILPAISISLPSSALVARLTRSSMLDALGEDYVRTARSKGLRELKVILKHVLRNASVAIITVVSFTFLDILSRAVVTEQIFRLPGIGMLVVQSIMARDYPVVQGILLVIACCYILINLVTDILYTFIDPRIRY